MATRPLPAQNSEHRFQRRPVETSSAAKASDGTCGCVSAERMNLEEALCAGNAFLLTPDITPAGAARPPPPDPGASPSGPRGRGRSAVCVQQPLLSISWISDQTRSQWRENSSTVGSCGRQPHLVPAPGRGSHGISSRL